MQRLLYILSRLKMRVGQTEKIQFKVAHVSLHVYCCNMICGVQYFNSQALNYPVDLYYLMDLSNSMSDDRENVVKVCRNWEDVKVRANQPEYILIWILIKLVQLGGELAKAIEAITPDYQIGWVGCSCCPFAHSMKWPDQPLQLVLWPPMIQ